jgi:hypothetical protein
MQIDHVFIRVAPGGAEAEALRAFGLSEGTPNSHPGQGTANRRFFFANGFLELLWLADEAEAASPATAPTRLHERLGDDSASPFGICFRPTAAQPAPTFAHFAYRPAYLPAGLGIDIASETPLSEPMWFFFSAASAPAGWEGARRQPLHHAARLQRLSAVKLTQPAAPSAVALATGIAFAGGDKHLLELTFDDAARGLMHDFRPALPLIFHY